MARDTTTQGTSPLVISYLEIRKGVGVIGIALPILLVAGYLIFEGPGIQNSISAYYHTVMRDVLVGCLWAIAVFLLSYRGYEGDDRIGDLASLFAIGVALFPVTPAGSNARDEFIIGWVHWLFAAALFLTLAYFCLVLFRKGKPDPTPQKRKRNWVYTVSGWLILACIAGIAAVSLFPDSRVHDADPVFWLEAIAVWAFGWAWFTKGEGILKDHQEQ